LKTIYLAGGSPKNTAIKVLTEHLEGLGHRVTRDAQDPDGWDKTIRWGVSYHGNKTALNGKVNQFNKMEHLEIFAKNNIIAPEVYRVNNMPPFAWLAPYPWLARKVNHAKGKDIIVCNTTVEAIEASDVSDFYTPWIPTRTEYRVWVFRNKALAIYEKVFKGEGEYEGFMRNHRFGFRFDSRDELLDNKELTKPSIAAVKAIDLDFGAVDVLLGKDGKYYVLEVNSQPHIDSVKRVSGIRLAREFLRWAEG
jgi:hypothetical protein